MDSKEKGQYVDTDLSLTRQTRKPTYIADLLVDRVHTRELRSSADSDSTDTE